LTKVVDFTKENWDIFGITDLRSTDFIEAGGSYFKPIASTAQILENPRLAEALLQKTEFTQQEWDEFGVDGLRMHHFVKSGNSYFRPGTEAQDVRVLRPLAHYGDFGEDGRLKWGVGDELVVGEAFTITFVRNCNMGYGDRGYDVEEKEELAKDTVGTVLDFNADGAAKIAFREPVPNKSESESGSKGGGFRSTTATTGARFGAFGAGTDGGVGRAKHVSTGGGFGGGGFGASAGGGFGADTGTTFGSQPSAGAFCGGGFASFVGSTGSAFGAPTGAFGGGGAAAAAQDLAPLTAQQLAAFGVTSAPAFGQPAPAAPAFGGGGAFGASTWGSTGDAFGQPAAGGVGAATGAVGATKGGAFPPYQAVGFGAEEKEEEEEEEGKREEEGWRRRTRWVPADQFYCLFPRPGARDTPSQRLVKLGRLRRCEVVALILYTGPMFVLYNAILRDVGFCGAAAADIEFASDEFLVQWKEKDIKSWVQLSGHKFTNTIHALASAIKKLQGLADKTLVTRLYRGLGGLDVGAFLKSCGFTDKAFMSTTKDRRMALEYSGVKSGLIGTVLCIETSTTNNGAVLVSFSQYPGEEETVWNACSFMQHLPGKDEVELLPEGGVVRIFHVLVSANSRAETVEELEGCRKRVVLQVLDTLHADVCRAIDAAAATAEFKARLAQDHGQKAFGGGTYEKDFILSIKDESAARVAVYKKLPDRAFAEIETLGEAVSKGLALPLLANAKLRLWLEDLSLSLFNMGCRLSSNTTYLGLNAAQGRRLSRRRLRLQDNSTAGLRGSIDQVGRIVVEDGLRRMGGASTAALALEDCRERRLVTGAGAAALDRRDAFSGETPLITQVHLGEYENVERLLQAGADANAATAGGERALLMAAKEGRVDLVGLLAGFRAEVDARDALGRTSLHWMSETGNADMVQVLLKLGADVMAKDQSTVAPTSLEKASKHGHLAVVQTLLEHGADVAARDKYGDTSLHHASEEGHVAVVQTLLQHCADVAARANGGRTSLHYAIKNLVRDEKTAWEARYVAVVETLLQHGADVDARDKYDVTPRDMLMRRIGRGIDMPEDR
jgi:ankyrin repeat protein